jgi:CheY-like chemotaxis protein
MEGYILITDDYFPIRHLMYDVLIEEGFMTQMVANGKECLELSFSENKPALILLDWHMPGMTGYEVLKELKGDLTTNGIPVIMVTGEIGIEEIALEAGAIVVIPKPIDFKALLREVRSALQDKEILDLV